MVVHQFVDTNQKTPGRCKKRISGSVGELARTGKTGDPVLTAIFLAQHINTAAGGTVIAPWDIPDLPDEWPLGALALNTRLEKAKKANKIIDQKLAAWQANHPAYQKHI